MFCRGYSVARGPSASSPSFSSGVPVSALGCANAGVSWDLLALGRSKVELAGRVNLFMLCHEGCRGIKEWVLLVAWA